MLGAGLAGGASDAEVASPRGLAVVEPLPEDLTPTWIGPAFWANRFQDWRLHRGRIECLAGDERGHEVRTVAVLTREIVAGSGSAHLSVRAGALGSGRGFCGFLVGAGGGALDYRAAALVQRASGLGGGILCAYESDGHVRFREHTDEENPLAFAELPSEEAFAAGPAAEALLQLDITVTGKSTVELAMGAWTAEGRPLGFARRRGVAESDVLGGLALVSSNLAGQAGARYWFSDLRAGGRKVAARPERRLGPVLGTLYSLNSGVLKLTAQLLPVAEGETRSVRLQFRPVGVETWREAASASLEHGFTALFRIEGWDGARDHEYRVLYGDAPSYGGRIRRDPGDRAALTIALLSCTAATARSLEGTPPAPPQPASRPIGRYRPGNFYFPHRELVRHVGHHEPDLLVFAGDQLYQGNPTRREPGPDPALDYLYKWALWLWAFRDLTRDTPAVVLVDDHDVYQGNVWRNGGRPAPANDQNRGGYVCAPAFVNLVQRTQCGHDPDPYDPTPVDQGIGVYFASFRYGGVSFAILEDRKFKTAPLQGEDLDVHEAELLGARQERFLEAWAREPAEARVCLTQTLFACVQTSPSGRPLQDFDSNGYPKPGRDRAIALLREAGALVLAGDQHLASLVRHGVDTFTDGVVQFTGPAGGTGWQRWFEPREPLPNARGPHTGDFTDAFGNRLRVLAAANPKVTFAEYRRHRAGRPQDLADRHLKSEGYGIVRVDRRARQYVLECWPWDVDPASPGARQFEGWPYRLSFDECDGRGAGLSAPTRPATSP